MAARDIEQGQSPSHLADATPLHGEDQTAEGQELQLQHPEGVPVILGPPAIIAEGTRGVEPIPSQPCAFWSETAKLEHALRTHRPAHLDQDARRQASARPRAELVEQGAEASGVEDCGVPAGDVDEEQVDARLFEPPRTRQPQLEADRLILEQMRDLLAAVVTQQQEYSRRLERLEEEQAMRSAASGRTALDARVDDQLGAAASKGPNEGRETRDVSGVSAERVVAGSSGSRMVAQAPTEKPGGACQHFYIGDSLPPSREDGREMSVPAKVHEQSRLTESDPLGRILCLPDDEMMVVKRRIESQSRSDADRMYLWRGYFLQKDKLGQV